ncbi:MAG: dethiobiotin synthase [Lachnospiraceae bacterium]|nr:dethiobiotin synthase [Lachnospiraceae bacterium]
MSKNLFITGTGTDIGKTFVSALLAKALHELGRDAAYYKAAMSGNDRRADQSLIPGDAYYVKETSGISQPLEEMCPYVYEHAYSPHLASRLEGNPVTMEVVEAGFHNVCEKHEYVTMEGSGGILCPLEYGREKLWLEDVIKKLGLSCLVVADAGLGTINHVVLTVEYMRSRGIKVKGIVFNRCHPGNILEEDNRRMCEERTGIKVIAQLGEQDRSLRLTSEEVLALYE